MEPDFERFRAELERERERLGFITDMVGQFRDAGIWQPARKCPNCGRYAHAEAGNPSEFYWMITDCVKCGRWECRGGPMEWRSNPYLSSRHPITVRNLNN